MTIEAVRTPDERFEGIHNPSRLSRLSSVVL
jgi:hypothetical protein